MPDLGHHCKPKVFVFSSELNEKKESENGKEFWILSKSEESLDFIKGKHPLDKISETCWQWSRRSEREKSLAIILDA